MPRVASCSETPSVSRLIITQKVQDAILTEYKHQVSVYQDLATTVAALLGQMLRGGKVQVHSITQRHKSHGSLTKKLTKPEKEYAHLADITDLAAIRITTYFADDVDLVAKMVEQEFLISLEDSVDKRLLLDPDRFGYQSLHYVASLTSERCHLVEYKRFEGRKFELQVRSILQHAWAEIEHDLGYKSAAGIPKSIRRKFSRIAGLLELADDEFSAIRAQLAAYSSSVAKEIEQQPETVSIDKISLKALLSAEDSPVRRLSLAVAQQVGAVLTATTDASLERAAGHLDAIDIRTVDDLLQKAASRLETVEAYAKIWLEGNRLPLVDAGIGILYLAYVMLGEQGKKTKLMNFVKQRRLGIGDGEDKLSSKILEVYAKTKAAR